MALEERFPLDRAERVEREAADRRPAAAEAEEERAARRRGGGGEAKFAEISADIDARGRPRKTRRSRGPRKSRPH